MPQGILQKAIAGAGNSIIENFFSKEKKGLALSEMALRNQQQVAVQTGGGLARTGKVTFDQLRLIADADTIVRICVNTIKKTVSQASWKIIPKVEYIDSYDRKHVEDLTEFFTLLNTNGENMREFLAMVLEDLLVLDAGVFEKVHNLAGDVIELNSIDGATIKPRYNKYGELGDPAYVQIIDNKVVAEFAKNEIVYMKQNPQNNIKSFGYGKSPIEEILMTVQSALNADLFNARTFSKDNMPAGLLDLGDMSNDEASKFVALWNASVINNTQKIKFTWGRSNATNKFTEFGKSQKDMQYMKYVNWLSRLKLAAYGLTSQDANITQDVNRATAQVQASLTQARGVNNIFTLIEEYFNREIILPRDIKDVEFKFDREQTLTQKKEQADIDKIYIDSGVMYPSDVAKREGFDSYEDEDKNIDINDGASPNPADKELNGDLSTPAEKKYYKPIYT